MSVCTLYHNPVHYKYIVKTPTPHSWDTWAFFALVVRFADRKPLWEVYKGF